MLILKIFTIFFDRLSIKKSKLSKKLKVICTLKKLNMTKKFLIIVTLLMLISHSVSAMPKIRTEFDVTVDNYARIKVYNETLEELICYVAIDGYKIMFKLVPRGQSIWYKATSTRFNYTDFSTWCGFLTDHPQYR